MALRFRTHGCLHVSGSCEKKRETGSPQGRCQDFDEYFSINRLPLSVLAFVLQANPSDREEILGRHLPQVIIEVPVSHFAEEAVFSASQNKNQQLKAALIPTKAMQVMEGGHGGYGSPRRLANRANVTQPGLLGVDLSADMSHEILHIATYRAAIKAVMMDRRR